MLLSLLAPTTPAAANPEIVKWSWVNIPTEGESGNWVLANGSDVQHLTMAIDGTLYCYANPSGTSYTLFKSTDGGYSWSYTGRVKDTIVDIAVAPDDASIVYYATLSDVHKSTDAGSSFIPLPPNPGGAGTDNLTITAIDVARLDGNSIIAVGTRDTDDLQYGGVYTLDESEVSPSWIDTNLVSYDVHAVAFSPNFPTDRQLVAVITDETDTLVTTKIGDSDWGETISDATIEDLVPASAGVTFPDDYDATSGDYVLFVAIDTVSDSGDVYMINGVTVPGSSVATDLNIGSAYGLSNVDVTTLAVTGNTSAVNILAGAANSAQVYISTDGGINWARSTKEPTGQSKTYVLMAADFTGYGRAYAATSGSESALSVTQDGGITWNQVGLIDTIVGIGNILDLTISPSYSQDNTLFMLTFDGKHSLWRSLNGGIRWERVFTSALANVASIKLVELSPQYGNGSQVVFVAGTSNGNPAIWKSIDNGQTFTHRSAPFSIAVWAVVSDNTLFIGSYDDSNYLGLVHYTTDSGSSYSTPAVAGSYQLHSIALSPNYDEDKTILVGNVNGWVYWSNDNGTTFEPLGQQLPQLIVEEGALNDIAVALDPQFSTNHTVYTASHCYKDTNHSSAIYRFIIGTSATWESIDSNLPTGSMLGQLRVSADGTLYATNLKADGGMERCLNPTFPLAPTFETVTRGLDDGAALSGLWLRDNVLWSIDAKNTKLMTYTDSLAVPVTLTSPPNQAPGIGTITGSTIRDVSLDWEPLSGATTYQWQLDYNADFSTIPLEGDTEVSSTRLPALEPATTYYWRVRVTDPVLSPWSATRSFATSLGTSVIAPSLRSPSSGAKNVEQKPVFQWSAIAGAESYELLVSRNVYFTDPIIKKIGVYALPVTAWQSDMSLDYDTTYYWKVRAIGSNTHSAWSDVGAFTTRSASASEPLPSYSTAPVLNTPRAGARGESVKPIFQWSTIAEADSYELLVATDASFANPIIIKIGAYALPSTAWQCDIGLDYDTTYYWKVRAGSSGSYGDWSAVGVFTTEPAPSESLPPELSSPPPPSSSPSPSPAPPQLTIPNWLQYLIGGLLLIIVLLLIITLVLVVGIRRS